MSKSIHYHVLQGLAGLYMPNSNDVYRTRKEAEAGAREAARIARDEGYKVRGNAWTGYEVGSSESIEVTTCDIADCLEAEELV